MLNVRIYCAKNNSIRYLKSGKILKQNLNNNENFCYSSSRSSIFLKPLKLPPNFKLDSISENNKKMGCASSQASTVNAILDPQGNGEAPITSSNEGNSSLSVEGISSSSTNEISKYPKGEAFEIPLDDNNQESTDIMNESIIKKHPPKRLQRLTETTVQPTTIESLEEKLVKAEIRRQKFLQQRIEGAVNSLATSGIRSLDDEDQEDGGQNDDNDDEFEINADNNSETDTVKMKNSINSKMNTNDENFEDIEETRNRNWTRPE